MNKIFIIARREFLSRVQKKTFLLTTILLPVIIFGFYGMIIYFSVKSADSYKIAVADNANVFGGKIENGDDIFFRFVEKETVASLKEKVAKKELDGYVWVASNFEAAKGDTLSFISGKTVGLMTRDQIQKKLGNALEEHRLLSTLQISKSHLDSLQKGSEIKFATLEGKEENDAKIQVSYIIGYISGFMIYIILFIYGTMVMRGVMEEKTNRIAEVIISSVKPFQLMMGKITGIGAVGLLQFLIWIGLTIFLRGVLPIFIPGMSDTVHAMPGGNGVQAIQQAKDSGALAGLLHGLDNINLGLLAGCFIFYFLGGYLLYSALFAAVGSTVNEDPQDAQSLSLPITMPIIFAIVIMTRAVNDPTGSLAVFGSLFPLTSPIVMMARIPFGVPNTVPYWQLILSMLLLIGGFMFTTWLSGKIYRTGILMYGKKPTWKEMWKWVRR
ncbi:ABC transporter permease [Parasediminibacterium sp. JCM 36343]|uniref:ABC transporter permease n=1 Tax=Parasediminibacterium sp. JCM 36343 TaxID=3374279 RepID=UPI00397D3781